MEICALCFLWLLPLMKHKHPFGKPFFHSTGHSEIPFNWGYKNKLFRPDLAHHHNYWGEGLVYNSCQFPMAVLGNPMQNENVSLLSRFRSTIVNSQFQVGIKLELPGRSWLGLQDTLTHYDLNHCFLNLPNFLDSHNILEYSLTSWTRLAWSAKMWSASLWVNVSCKPWEALGPLLVGTRANIY